MSNNCSLCNAELTSMDTLLGANRLSDGGILCNKCLDKISNLNQELLYNLNTFSIGDINSLLQKGKTESVVPIIQSEQNLPSLTEPEPQDISGEVYKRRKRKINMSWKTECQSFRLYQREIKELPYLISEDEKSLR
ncbi:DUF4428 domain-containing protein [Chryseobacterium arthrosphaerae]|uniref:DUF4428 domain-containing protein n=1 Tax=Chryseobacterium arthrosphaerae TaxID=651561 RepID=A0A3S0Q4L3_9FLAO|nr:DUF4428 domain-containing protein [Chryseobacterium arthrosphaerae]